MWDRLAEERERDEIADHNGGSIRTQYPLLGFGFWVPKALSAAGQPGPNGKMRDASIVEAKMTFMCGPVFPASAPHAAMSMSTISGGTPSRTGTKLVPSPPETIMCRPSSMMCP
jgi:hypothetical protein